MDADHARELLARERARVERSLAGGINPGTVEDVPDPSEASDAGDRVWEASLSQAEIESLQEELAAIERAEQRLSDGTYGVSVDSGEAIADARLEAMPWAERTVEEQARIDAAG